MDYLSNLLKNEKPTSSTVSVLPLLLLTSQLTSPVNSNSSFNQLRASLLSSSCWKLNLHIGTRHGMAWHGSDNASNINEIEVARFQSIERCMQRTCMHPKRYQSWRRQTFYYSIGLMTNLNRSGFNSVTCAVLCLQLKNALEYENTNKVSFVLFKCHSKLSYATMLFILPDIEWWSGDKISSLLSLFHTTHKNSRKKGTNKKRNNEWKSQNTSFSIWFQDINLKLFNTCDTIRISVHGVFVCLHELAYVYIECICVSNKLE